MVSISVIRTPRFDCYNLIRKISITFNHDIEIGAWKITWLPAGCVYVCVKCAKLQDINYKTWKFCWWLLIFCMEKLMCVLPNTSRSIGAKLTMSMHWKNRVTSSDHTHTHIFSHTYIFLPEEMCQTPLNKYTHIKSTFIYSLKVQVSMNICYHHGNKKKIETGKKSRI